MANVQEIQRRIRSVKSTNQITKAMELVAASKMRKAQEASLRSRVYSNTARELLTRLSKLTDVSSHHLYKQRTVKTRLHILITSDRGLAGAYNANVLKKFVATLKEDLNESVNSQVLVIGKKGAQLATRLENLEIIGVYDKLPDQITAQSIQPILSTVMETYNSKAVEQINIIFTDYKSTIKQVVSQQTLLPAAFEPIEGVSTINEEVDFEPSPTEVINKITPRMVEVQLLQALLESAASEHSMRMMAMKNASDNASDLIDDLTLEYNGARQAAITQELAEITGGAEAIA